MLVACGDSGTEKKTANEANSHTNSSRQTDVSASQSSVPTSADSIPNSSEPDSSLPDLSITNSSQSNSTSSAGIVSSSAQAINNLQTSSEAMSDQSQTNSSEAVISTTSSRLALGSSSSSQFDQVSSINPDRSSSFSSSKSSQHSSSSLSSSPSDVSSSENTASSTSNMSSYNLESSSAQSNSFSSLADIDSSSDTSAYASSSSDSSSSSSTSSPESSLQNSSESAISDTTHSEATEGSAETGSESASSEAPVDYASNLQERVEQNVLQGICAVCHSANSLASGTNLIFQQSSIYLESNIEQLIEFINTSPNAKERLLSKSLGQLSHGGGKILDEQSADYQDLDELVTQLSHTDLNVPQSAEQDLALEPVEKSLRRASLVLASRLPTNEELILAKSGEDGFKNALYSIMQGEGFHRFLIEYSNRRLLTDVFFDELQLEVLDRRIKYYPAIVNKKNQAYKQGKDSIREYLLWEKKLLYGLTRAPLELIAYVVENDLPYSKILTADFSMLNPQANEAFNAGITFDDDNHTQFKPGQHHGQTILNAAYRAERDTDNLLYISSFEQVNNYPHSGILSEPAFLNRYASTFTNKNRARSRWTYFHFLGLDVERLTQNTSLSASESPISNPTLNDPNCSVCHRILDPLAGSFQYFDDYGVYKAAEGGKNSLPTSYTNYSPLYTEGDTWYKDMRIPGFEETTFGSDENTLKSAANLIVKDKRFASAAIKFWWPAIIGTEFPSNLANTSILPSDAYTQDKLHWVSELETGFRNGFHGSKPENIKDLFVQMFSSRWFRLAKTSDHFGDINYGLPEEAKYRLLSPAQYEAKAYALTGNFWPSNKDRSIISRGVGAISNEFKTPFGDQDSNRISKPLSYSSSLTYNTVLANALRISCDTVINEFEQDQKNRINFKEISRFTKPSTVFEDKYLLFSDAASQSIIYQTTMESPLAFNGLLMGHERTSALQNRTSFWIGRILLSNSKTGETKEIDSKYFTEVFNTGIENGKILIEDGLYLNLFANSDEKGWLITSNRLFIPLPDGQYDSIAITLGSNSHMAPTELSIHLTDSNQSEGSLGEKTIKNILTNLHQRYWGTSTPNLKNEVDQSYHLFKQLLAVSGRNSEDNSFYNSCLNGRQVSGSQIYDTDGMLETWTSMLIYFLTDYRFLHE